MKTLTCSEVESGQVSMDFSPSLDTPNVRTTLESAAVKLAIKLISQGKVHDVDIPLMNIFCKILEEMKAPMPSFGYVQTNNGMYRLITAFTVPNKYSNGPGDATHCITGEACSSIQQAENSTIMQAFDELARFHHIAVMDHSSTVVAKYEDRCRSIYRRVNSMEYALEYMLQQWDESIRKLEMLNLALEKKIMHESMASDKIFRDVGEQIRSIVQRFKDSYNAVHDEYKSLAAESQDYLKASNERYHLAWLQAPRKLWYSEKDVINYLMKYLGTQPAHFFNRPAGKYSFQGEVNMDLPEIPGVACGGITKITGTIKSSAARSEEKAAEAAIRFLERHLKIRITDPNYTERLNAKARKDAVKNLEARFRTLGTKIKEEWSYMLEYTRTTKELYGEHNNSRLSLQEIDGIDSDCASRFEAAISKLDAVEK
ncbi:hypothetical protein ACP4OV_001290 [Aristida adscensionis]